MKRLRKPSALVCTRYITVKLHMKWTVGKSAGKTLTTKLCPHRSPGNIPSECDARTHHSAGAWHPLWHMRSRGPQALAAQAGRDAGPENRRAELPRSRTHLCRSGSEVSMQSNGPRTEASAGHKQPVDRRSPHECESTKAAGVWTRPRNGLADQQEALDERTAQIIAGCNAGPTKLSMC